FLQLRRTWPASTSVSPWLVTLSASASRHGVTSVICLPWARTLTESCLLHCRVMFSEVSLVPPSTAISTRPFSSAEARITHAGVSFFSAVGDRRAARAVVKYRTGEGAGSGSAYTGAGVGPGQM